MAHTPAPLIVEHLPWTTVVGGFYLVSQPNQPPIAYASFREDAILYAAASDLLEALKLAQRWLANCVPVAEIDGPKPLPIIAAVIAKAEGRG